MSHSTPILLLPKGLLAKIRQANNGFRTKREVAEMFASLGLTYEMMFDMAEGNVRAEERDINTCQYESNS